MKTGFQRILAPVYYGNRHTLTHIHVWTHVQVWRCQRKSCTTFSRHAHADGAPIIVIRSTPLSTGAGPLSATETYIKLGDRRYAGIEDGSYVKINSEIMRVTHAEISARNLRVLRGQAGTTAAVQSDGSDVYIVFLTTLNTYQGRAISSSDVNINVVDVTHPDSKLAFGNIFVSCFIRLDHEVMLVTGISGTELTVMRGQGGTVAAPHTNGTVVRIVEYMTLSGSMASGATTAAVSLASDLYPRITVGAYLQIESEIIRVSAVSGDTLTVARGQRSTAATAHSAGVAVVAVLATRLDASNTLSVLRAQAGTTAAYHDDGAAVTTVVPINNLYGGSRCVFGGKVVSWVRATGTAVMRVGGSSGGTTVNAVGVGDTSLIVTSAAQISLAAGSFLRIDSEIIRVASVATNTATVVRGVAQSSPSPHVDAAIVELVDMSALSSSLAVGATAMVLPATVIGRVTVTVGMYILVGDEVVRCEGAASAPTYTISRAHAGTVDRAHGNGARVSVPPQTSLSGSIAANPGTITVVSAYAAQIVAGSHIQIDSEIMQVSLLG
jgi:hypothetical protein